MVMPHGIKIVEMTPKDHRAVLDLTKLLPQWFDGKARERYIPLDLKLHQGCVAFAGDRLLGFVTFTSKTGSGIISWIGVHPDHHRQGIGRRLLETGEEAGYTWQMAEYSKELG